MLSIDKAAVPPFRCTSAIACKETVVLPELSGPYTSIIRPRGYPPTPNATSNAKEPLGIVEIFDQLFRLIS